MNGNVFRGMTLLLFLPLLLTAAPMPGYCAPELTKGEAGKTINKMLTPDIDRTAEVKQITPQKGGICAVLVDPPFREFPNVVVFKYDKEGGAWKRVKECLSFGIMFPSPEDRFPDTHALGIGIDMVHQEKSTITFDKDMKELVDYLNKKNFDVSVYQTFIHYHMGGKSRYFIDKTNYQDLSQQLLGDFGNAEIEKKYKGTCMLYGQPALTKIGLSYSSKKNVYTIFGKTGNGQEWKATFSGVDEGNKYLLNKTVTAKGTSAE